MQTLRDFIELVSVDKNLDPVSIYVAYVDEHDDDTTCYSGDYDKKKMLKEISERDLNKEVLHVEVSCNHITRQNYIQVNIKCDY